MDAECRLQRSLGKQTVARAPLLPAQRLQNRTGSARTGSVRATDRRIGCTDVAEGAAVVHLDQPRQDG
jgi:hypothetical protein